MPVIADIPSGCFVMGSPETELGRGDNEILHRVCIQAFKLAKHEVSVAEFKQFITATHYVTDAERNREEQGCWSYQQNAEKHWDWWQWANWKAPVGRALQTNEPVTCVSFDDVTAYIDWLNKVTGQHYRLPTEAEWEYAARAGTATARYWGNNPNIACAYANVADESKSVFGKWMQAHHCEDGHFFSVAVTALHANKFGLHNMLGNAWEWTCSRYDEKYSGAETRCITKKLGFEDMIVIRGGGWNADPDRVRAGHRNWSTVWSRQANLGFRLVREY
ncbi:SUMF1/EgtB/PvdO family nonheme iron enzyme [Methylovulum sp.]|uniref:formylglycine-generating enzyme family protein n=1 Tax=Methylovulum sp. TaxID=1916980 RepID=UPI002634D80E|nr:SUMF1/EgtB/PvdO family nonheme iron enzyme [Methylovulum sp.]MDD5124601.1 SUMF1/EgtB/PvdO family nonheme iron enzyme [Methylovulum sp.]